MGKADNPDRIDVQVGRNIRAARRAQGVSQAELARRMGLTFQQLQKYESGANRVAASRLVQIASALDLPVTDLLRNTEGLGAPTLAIIDPELAWGVHRLKAIRSPAIRKSAIKLLNALADLDRQPVASAQGAGVGQAGPFKPE